MGCAASSETIENKRIDKLQLAAAQENAKIINLLLIGSGDSGKTTLRKQITNVQNRAFADAEYRKTFSAVITDNLVDGCLTVLGSLSPERLEPFKDARDEIRSDSAKKSQGWNMNPELGNCIKALALDPSFQNAIYQSQKTIHLQECFLTFIERMKKYPIWGGQDWIPSIDECIRARTRTSGVVREMCKIKNVNFCLMDVGGQRAERRKWLHVFEDVTAAIFVAALSDYDGVLFEDSTKNRLEEAVELFSECVNSQWLYNTPTMLFLNKMDIFKHKLITLKIPLNVSGRFPQAPDNPSLDVALQWISELFKSRKSKSRRPAGANTNKPTEVAETYVHFTTATDPQNVKKVFMDTADIILKNNLKSAGFTLGA